MKFSYSQKLDKYVVTELGRLIDSDEDGIALGIRHGFVSEYSEDEEQESFLITVDDDDNALLEDFGVAPASDDDDLALINDLLFNDDHDTATNYQSTGIGA